ncbi:MAG: hypothetical protein UBAL2_85240041 [Leptospirillum rubarum]|nr:MAG: hypothetical protein UBAL2_85240041 [Leptospirillum rubarum]
MSHQGDQGAVFLEDPVFSGFWPPVSVTVLFRRTIFPFRRNLGFSSGTGFPPCPLAYILRIVGNEILSVTLTAPWRPSASSLDARQGPISPPDRSGSLRIVSWFPSSWNSEFPPIFSPGPLRRTSGTEKNVTAKIPFLFNINVTMIYHIIK